MVAFNVSIMDIITVSDAHSNSVSSHVTVIVSTETGAWKYRRRENILENGFYLALEVIRLSLYHQRKGWKKYDTSK